jgi:hypothetical protein
LEIARINRCRRRHSAIFVGVRPNFAWELVKPEQPVIRRLRGFPAMTRSPRAAGFEGQAAPVASSRLINAVAASLAIGSLSLCGIVALTMLSIKVSMACPLPM